VYRTEPELKAPRTVGIFRRTLTVALLCLATALGASAQDRSIAGRFLVASESMGDPRFRQTVIYMIEHNQEGALGLVVNRPLGTAPVAALLERLGLDPAQASGEISMAQGGPVEPGRGFVLHSAEVMDEHSEAIGPGVALGPWEIMLRQIGRGEGPKHSLFILGYAGWAPGQLDGELARGDWFVILANPDAVFAKDPAQTWRRALQQRGVDL